MKFKLKAWMQYLIGVATIPPMFTLWTFSNYVIDYTPLQFYSSALGNVTLYGGIGLGIYYAIFQRFTKRKEKPTFKDTMPAN